MCGSGTRRLSSELREQLSRDCVGRFGCDLHGKTHSAQLAPSYREGGVRWHVRPRNCCVPSTKTKVRTMGVISTTPRICFDDGMTMRHQHGGAPGETTRHTHAQPVAQSHTIGTAVKHSHTVRRSAPRWVSPLPIRVAQATSPRPLLSGHIAAQSIVPHPIFRAGSPHRWPGRANFA